jgi:hypothetical protein
MNLGRFAIIRTPQMARVSGFDRVHREVGAGFRFVSDPAKAAAFMRKAHT